jgi:hypothetical protein
LVSSLSLAWASALFQMMNPPLCIVTLLSLPGRLPPWLPAQACLLAHLPRGRPDLVGGCICKNLQSDSTFAWGHREIRNELPHLEATLVIYKVSAAPHSFTASASITWPAKTASWAPRTESIECSLVWQGFRVFRLNLSIGGISCCKSPRSRGDVLRCRRRMQ